LTDIPPAPRGMPQVDVAFDIDANGILNVSAKDKATGKEQKIVIKASSGLSDDEIDQMVVDAEVHAAEDQKFRELVDMRNQGDALVHATEKMLEELGEKAEADERARIESATSELKEAVVGDNKEAIEAKIKVLSEASATLAQKLYAEKNEADTQSSEAAEENENVVDAEFEEVEDSDDKKKSV